jgi:ferredoxin
MSKQSLYKLGHIYGNMLNNISVVEEKTLPTKAGPGAKELNDEDAAKLQNGGPSEKGGFKPAEIDANKMSEKDNVYGTKNLTVEENPDEDEENFGKINHDAINNFMSKSIFEKLYENVMAGNDVADTDELSALGIETSDEKGSDVDVSGGEETVTITLDKQLAQKLHTALMEVIDGKEKDETEDVGDEEETGSVGEEDEETIGHALCDAKVPSEFHSKDNKVSSMKLKPNGKAGDGKYTDEVDDEADELGHALYSTKAPDAGKNNKVKSTKTSKPGSDAFAA